MQQLNITNTQRKNNNLTKSENNILNVLGLQEQPKLNNKKINNQKVTPEEYFHEKS